MDYTFKANSVAFYFSLSSITKQDFLEYKIVALRQTAPLNIFVYILSQKILGRHQ